MIIHPKFKTTNSYPRDSKQTDDQIGDKNTSNWMQNLVVHERDRNRKGNRDKTSSKQYNPQSDQVSQDKQEEKPLEEKGLDASVKKQATKKEDDRQKLKNMVSNSNRLLIGSSAMFPFDLFPDTINVEATRVNIIRRSLFFSKVHSVDIKDISNVFLSQNLIFAEITIVSKTFRQNEIKIKTLSKNKAIEVRRIIEGLRMMSKANIDMSSFSVEELNDKLRELSSTEIVL